jgi:hypothetical protein
VGFLLAAIINTLLNWVIYDLLIQIESEKFQIDWANDGKPIGMFYTPKDASLIAGAIRRNQILSKWVLRKPRWIVKDERARILYKIFKLTGFINLFLFVSLGILFIVIFFIQP